MSEAYDEYVEQEVIPRMKCVCAWHEKYFGVEKVLREAEEGAGPGVTHSICEECRAEFKQAARTEDEDKRNLRNTVR